MNEKRRDMAATAVLRWLLVAVIMAVMLCPSVCPPIADAKALVDDVSGGGLTSRDDGCRGEGGEQCQASIAVTFPAEGDTLIEGQTSFFEVLTSNISAMPMTSGLRMECDGQVILFQGKDDLLASGGIARVDLQGLAVGGHVFAVSFTSSDGDGLVWEEHVDFTRREVRVHVADAQQALGAAQRGSASSRGVPLPATVVPAGDESWTSGSMEGPRVMMELPTPNSVLKATDEDEGAVLKVRAKAEAAPEGAYLSVRVDRVHVFAAAGCELEVEVGGLKLGQHVVSLTLHERGGGVLLDGESCGACVAPFRVDVRVWEGVDAQVRGEGFAGMEKDGLLKMKLEGAFTWTGVMAAYRQYHAEALLTPPGTVGLYVYTPRDCGMGNRMIDLATSFLVAILSRRILVVNWTLPVPLSLLCESPLDIFPDSPAVQPHLQAARESSMLRIDDGNWRDSRPLSDVIGHGLGGRSVEYVLGPVLRAVYGDFSYTSSKEFGLLHPELGIALGSCLRGLITPSPLVEASIRARLGASNALGGSHESSGVPDTYTIGVHVRVTMGSDASGGGDTQIGPASGIPLRSVGQAMVALTTLAVSREAPAGARIFLSTDREEVREAWKAHPELGGARLSTSDDDVRHTARDPHVDGHVAAHADWWALSRCHDLVLTRHSTFGYTAAGLSGRVPLTAFEHKVERRFHCGPFDLCDMHPPELV